MPTPISGERKRKFHRYFLGIVPLLVLAAIGRNLLLQQNPSIQSNLPDAAPLKAETRRDKEVKQNPIHQKMGEKETILVIAVPESTNTLDEETARERFLSRYPEENWKFFPATGGHWTRLVGGKIGHNSSESPTERAVLFFKEHEELLVGLPAGTQLEPDTDSILHTAAATFLKMKVEKNGIPLPGNMVLEVDKDNNIIGITNNMPGINHLNECDKIQQSAAEQIAMDLFKQRTSDWVVEILSQKTRKVYTLTSNESAEISWDIFLKTTEKELHIFHGAISTCTGDLLVPFRATEIY